MPGKSIEVSNLDVMQLALKKELKSLSAKLTETVKQVGTPKMNVNVVHLTELIRVIQSLLGAIAEINVKTVVEMPDIIVPEIKVPEIRIPEIKAPSVYVPEPKVTVNAPDVNVDLRPLLEALDNLKYLSDQPNKPLSVRMTDGKRWEKALRDLTKATEQAGVIYAGSSGLSTDDIRNVPVNSGINTGVIYSGGSTLTPKFAVIDDATSGDNTIVAAVTGKKIRVLQAFLISAGTVNTRFESNTGGTALTGQMNLIANTGFVLPFSPVGWFETVAGELLNLELSDAISVDGSLTYIEV